MHVITGTGPRSIAKDKREFDRACLIALSHIRLMRLYYPDPDELLVLCGGAEGFDHALARAAYSLRVPYKLVIPHPGYGVYYWKKHSQLGVDRLSVFRAMCKHAKDLIYVCKNPVERGEYSIMVRNRYMVDNADEVLVYQPTSGGSGHCYEYVKKTGKHHKLIL